MHTDARPSVVLQGWGYIYAYFTPSQGSANRSASGGVLGAMARPASANPGLFPVSPHLNELSPLINTPNVR